jgi:hypothetical protein
MHVGGISSSVTIRDIRPGPVVMPQTCIAGGRLSAAGPKCASTEGQPVAL